MARLLGYGHRSIYYSKVPTPKFCTRFGTYPGHSLLVRLLAAGLREKQTYQGVKRAGGTETWRAVAA